MPNYSLVACAEEHGTKVENVKEESTECTVVLRTPWSYRFSLIADLLTNRRSWPDLSGWANPPRAVTAACVPDKTSYSTSGQSCVYDHALVTVSYSTVASDLIAESLEPNVEFMILDHKRFRWSAKDGDPLLEGEAPGKQLYSLNLVRQLFKVAPPIPTSVITLPGCCNDAVYTSALLGLTFPLETLLYQPPTLQRTIKTDGSALFNISLKFSFRPDGWNKYWRAKTGTYEEIWDVEGSARHENYPPNDFSDFLY